MGTLLKVDEWKGASGYYYVADVHTWTGWRECADVLGADTLEDYIHLLETKYKATVYGTIGVKDNEPANVLFNWPVSDYTHAHQFKLDVNRIARKKNYLIQESLSMSRSYKKNPYVTDHSQGTKQMKRIANRTVRRRVKDDEDMPARLLIRR